MNDYRINQDGLEIIMEREGFKPFPYLCPAGILTIGYGHVILPGENFSKGITRAQGIELLKLDCIKKENLVRSVIKVLLNINQFSALVSLAYNIRNFENLGLIKNINDGIRENDPEWKQAYWEQYSKARDPKTLLLKVLKGLLVRRQKEYKLFIKPVTE
jgi:lysozyme